jgi:hypothetical protein
MKNLKKTLTIMAITLTVASTFLSCKQEVKVTPEEAKTFANNV